MKITKGCEGVVKLVIGGTDVEIEGLQSFGMSSSTTTESIPVLNNNCLNKNSVTSKEVTGSAEACWHCDDLAQQEWVCGETVEVKWWPKGEAPVDEDGNALANIPLFHGTITISSYDIESNAEDAVVTWSSDFVLDSEISSNLNF